jgi:hypothetical protein
MCCSKAVFDGGLILTDLGKGLHAKNGKAKIRPALERLCNEYVGVIVSTPIILNTYPRRGLTHCLDPRNAGVLVVQC